MARSRRRADEERQERRRQRRRLERRRAAFQRVGAPEQLEQRQLLAYQSVESLALQLQTDRSLQSLRQVTIVTHGFQTAASKGDSLMPLAEAVYNRAGSGNTWLLDYDVVTGDIGNGSLGDLGERGLGKFDLDGSRMTAANPTNVVLLWDWAAESNDPSAGWTGASADALFATLVEVGLANPALGRANPYSYHFIAHSFGSAVTSETVRRLAAYDVPVDQVTYLDPHDFDQKAPNLAESALIDIDGKQAQYAVGVPQGYGAAVWNNVTFADVYYQTTGESVVPGFLDVPQGRPIPGAYNTWLSRESLTATGLGVPADNAAHEGGDHSDVWQYFYAKTIADRSATTGYAYSRVANGAARPLGNFFAPGQDHTYSEPEFVTWNPATRMGTPNQQGLAALFPSAADRAVQFDRARWLPQFDTFDVYNGSITHPGGLGSALLSTSDYIPGWNNHGGTGAGSVARNPGDSALQLGQDLFRGLQSSREHNRLYVPPTAAALTFTMRVLEPGAGDKLVVKIGDTVLARTPVGGVDPLGNAVVDGNLGLGTRHESRVRKMLAVPAALAGKVNTLTVAVERVGGGSLDAIEATVLVDDIRFLTLEAARNARPWPTTDPLTLQQMRDKLAPYLAGITGVTVVTHGWQPTDGSGDSLSPLAQAIRERASAVTGRQAWLIDYDNDENRGLGRFDMAPGQSITLGDNPTELVIQWDWAPESNEYGTGWTEGSGDALFNALVGLGLVDPALGRANARSLHFIAHSFGCAATSEAVERN